MRDWVVALRPSPSAARAAVRSVFSVGVPLLLVINAGRPEWSLFAITAAFTAVYGRDAEPRARFSAQLSAALALVAATVLGAALTLSEAPVLVIVLGGALAAAGSLFSTAMRWLPPGPLFVVLSFASCADVPGKNGSTALHAAFIACATALWSLALGAASGIFVGFKAPAQGAEADRWAALLDRVVLSRAAWCWLAVTGAGVLSLLAIGRHTGWAMVAATAPFAGGKFRASVRRGVHRVVGTFFGSGVAWLVLGLGLRDSAAVVAIAVTQGFAELFVMQHYAFALLFITPSALIGAHLTSPTPAAALLRDRLADTALGACVGVAVLVVAQLLSRRRGSEA